MQTPKMGAGPLASLHRQQGTLGSWRHKSSLQTGFSLGVPSVGPGPQGPGSPVFCKGTWTD